MNGLLKHVILANAFTDVRAIQKLLYQHLMEETLTTELLQEFEQYLDRDIIVQGWLSSPTHDICMSKGIFSCMHIRMLIPTYMNTISYSVQVNSDKHTYRHTYLYIYMFMEPVLGTVEAFRQANKDRVHVYVGTFLI